MYTIIVTLSFPLQIILVRLAREPFATLVSTREYEVATPPPLEAELSIEEPPPVTVLNSPLNKEPEELWLVVEVGATASVSELPPLPNKKYKIPIIISTGRLIPPPRLIARKEPPLEPLSF
jgi:hypothetical protein